MAWPWCAVGVLILFNMNKVAIEVQKVYSNNLAQLINTSALRGGYNLQHLGKQVYKEEITIPSRLNEEVVTPINMETYLQDEHTGIFAIVARNLNKRWQYSRRWVMVTDLGIMAKELAVSSWYGSIHSPLWNLYPEPK